MGDNLRFSTLPELYTKAGHDVYLWSGSLFRNEGIKDLVWLSNPYILGVKYGPWNAGDPAPTARMSNQRLPSQRPLLHKNSIANIEIFHGFEATNLRPKIYYKPKKDPSLENVVFVDLGSITDADIFKLRADQAQYHLSILSEDIFAGKKFVEMKNEHIAELRRHTTYPTGLEDTVSVSSIFHYCDLLNSCYGFVCLHSGSEHLAWAMQEHNPNLEIVCMIHPRAYDSHKRRSLFYCDTVNHLLLDPVEDYYQKEVNK